MYLKHKLPGPARCRGHGQKQTKCRPISMARYPVKQPMRCEDALKIDWIIILDGSVGDLAKPRSIYEALTGAVLR